MRKLIVLLFACIACWSLISLGFRGGDPKISPNTIIPAAVVHYSPSGPQLFTLVVCCCDTQGHPTPCPTRLTISNLMLTGTSPSDSTWIKMLPHTLNFLNKSTDTVKTINLSMPGVQVETKKDIPMDIKK